MPGIVFASRALLPDVAADRSLDQVVDVATLPGIVGASFAMPDVHWGYGFPIGGVAATVVAAGGVVSPGGVGFDISCGVRLLLSPLERAELTPLVPELMNDLERTVPKGMGRGAVWDLAADGELARILTGGAAYAVERGHGRDRDLERCEDRGLLAGAEPDVVSDRALLRGLHQVGSLGSGNHFLEVQVVDQVLDPAAAVALGLHVGQVCVMIHSGSRGLGHQVCSDHLRHMEAAMARYGIHVPDRQLACVPVRSPEGEAYLAAMAAAANYGRANRQLLSSSRASRHERVQLITSVPPHRLIRRDAPMQYLDQPGHGGCSAVLAAALVGERVEEPGDELARLPARRPRARQHLELERDQHRRLELGQRQLRCVDPVEQLAGEEPAGLAPGTGVGALDDAAVELVLGAVGEQVHPRPHRHRLTPCFAQLDVGTGEEGFALLHQRHRVGVAAPPQHRSPVLAGLRSGRPPSHRRHRNHSQRPPAPRARGRSGRRGGVERGVDQPQDLLSVLSECHDSTPSSAVGAASA